MTKIMVVEDDSALREIYSIRITAEGYNVVSAGDGEEALAMAVREKPDLILSDVMMPKISGFDMLDILRTTPETANIKVIMMTALSGDDQRQRGERLGADRYLVKSQVGIEDVVNAIHDILGDRQSATPVAAPATTPQPTDAAQPTPAPQPAASTAYTIPPAAPVASAVPVAPAPQPAPVAPQPAPAPQPVPTQPVMPAAPTPQPTAQPTNYGQPTNPAQ